MGDNRPSESTESVLVRATAYGAWKGAVLPASAGLVFLGLSIGLNELNLILIALAFVLAGALRAMWWARTCSTGQLLDRDNALVWTYRGEVRDTIPWSDLRHIVFERGSRQIMWSLGTKTGGPFPHILVDSRTDPSPSGFRYFADLMLLNPTDLKTADRNLAEACRHRGITFHGVDSNW
ncbi:hypothetical protein GCM10009554_18790 [Kribbella koreensis]|uniref:PH (Pleckstrin Homology) domain-containing protein n=1 Tax=Kribbella koreensis TaxID=57909 RepID=A0ABP4A9N2_9ACTN